MFARTFVRVKPQRYTEAVSFESSRLRKIKSKLMDKKTQTINTYNENANALAFKFDKLGARTGDIKETFSLVGNKNPKVLEIGCGNGRDAEEIIRYANNYVGIDISEKLIQLAHQKIPRVKFEVADIETYNIPKNLDVVFAFASLIHVPKESLEAIFEKLFESLNSGGIIRISLKQSDTYKEVTNEDEFGVRTYYHYSLEDIDSVAKGFIYLKKDLHNFKDQSWLEIILKKQ